MPLPGQQVQAAAVTGMHTDGPISTQHLAWGTVAARLAVPHAVLEGQQERALVSRKQGLKGGGISGGTLGRSLDGEDEEGEESVAVAERLPVSDSLCPELC